MLSILHDRGTPLSVSSDLGSATNSFALPECIRQPLNRRRSGRSVGTHTQTIAQAASDTDHVTVFAVVHVGSALRVEARSVVRRMMEIAHVLKGFY